MAKEQKKNPHEGHRKKLKKRFLTEGLDHFEDHNILELILFFAIPRRDTNEVAHALLSKFGSLSRVFEAGIEDLCRVDGIGENAAHLIKTYPAVAKRYYADRFQPSKQLREYALTGQELVLHFAGLETEQAYALFYDNSLGFCGDGIIHEGSLNSVAFYLRRLCDEAVRNNASYLILAHNHPHGLPIASAEDLSTTKVVRSFLAQMDITLIDHFIVGENRFSSIQREVYEHYYQNFLLEVHERLRDEEVLN